MIDLFEDRIAYKAFNKELSQSVFRRIRFVKEVFQMKIGMRKPSIKKSISARTTGRVKRSVKRALIPGYGRKGMGWVKILKELPTTSFTERPPLGD